MYKKTFHNITANNNSCRARPRPHLMILMLTFLSLAWMKSTKSLVSVKSSALASERVIRSSNFLLPELVVVGGPSLLQQEIVKESGHQNENSPEIKSFCGIQYTYPPLSHLIASRCALLLASSSCWCLLLTSSLTGTRVTWRQDRSAMGVEESHRQVSQCQNANNESQVS